MTRWSGREIRRWRHAVVLSPTGLVRTGNLFDDLPRALPVEHVDVLLASPASKIERIVSTGQATPPGEWYDAARGEWVVVLRGRAALRFEDEDELLVMAPGDWVDIPPHRRHRVEWTDPAGATVWLAVYY